MTMPPEIRKMMKAMIEQADRAEREAYQMNEEIKALIAESGVALHPLGVHVVIGMMSRVFLGLHDHTRCQSSGSCQAPSAAEVFKIVDDFMLIWARRRYSNDPRFSIQLPKDHFKDERVLKLHAPDPKRVSVK